jgi:DNA-binding transcriptional ArsR family regulator
VEGLHDRSDGAAAGSFAKVFSMARPVELERTAMWAVSHPVRFRLWELLREGPATASQLGRRLGESRGSASYHLRMLAAAGLIVEDEALGTKRERWWRRPDEPTVAIARGDPEGRELDRRMLAMFFARDADVRRRFVLGRPSDEWQEASFVGNWFVALTPAEADELGRRLFQLVDEMRARPASAGAEQTLVSLRILPVLEDP